MGGLSPIHWLIVIAVVAILFGGRGKLSGIMGDAAKGIRAFKEGLKDEPPQTPAAPVQITAPPQSAASIPPQPAQAAPDDRRDPSR